LLSAKLYSAACYLCGTSENIAEKKYERRLQAKMQNHNRASGRTRVNGSGARIKSLSPKRKGFAHQAKYLVYVPRAAGRVIISKLRDISCPASNYSKKYFCATLSQKLMWTRETSSPQFARVC